MVCLIVNVESMFNVLNFELKQDDNPSESFPQWNFHLNVTNLI